MVTGFLTAACYHGDRPFRPRAPHAGPRHPRRLARVSPAIPAGKDLDPADQAAHQSARPRARLHPGRRGRLRRDRPRSGGGAQPDRARQPGRRGHQRHGRAGSRPDRAAGREAGDGGQGGIVQEIRRHRLLRPRDRRARSGQAGRDHRRARADVRRHQPRGHQGAGMLLCRAQAARAPEDPGVPRRSARHGDHRRRRDHQRPARGRQGIEGRQAGLLGRRRRGAGLPRPARPARHPAAEHLGRRHRGRRLRGPARGDGRQQGALRAADRGAQARRDPRRCRHLPGPVRRRRC